MQVESIFSQILDHIKGLFTPSVSIDSHVDTSVDAWKEYIILIASFTPIVSIGVNTSVKIKWIIGPIQKRQRWRSVWTPLRLCLRQESVSNAVTTLW